MFKFRLAKVLRLREHKEKLCLEEVSRCLMNLQTVEQKKMELKQNMDKKEEEYRLSLEKIVSIERIVVYKNYLSLQKQKLLQLTAELETCRQKLTNAQAELRAAMKERKILTKLREKQQWRFRLVEKKKEENFLDELAINSSRRQSG